MKALDKPSERRELPANGCHTFLPIGTFLPHLLQKCGYISHLHLCIAANALPHFLLKTATLNFYSHPFRRFIQSTHTDLTFLKKGSRSLWENHSSSLATASRVRERPPWRNGSQQMRNSPSCIWMGCMKRPMMRLPAKCTDALLYWDLRPLPCSTT